jgi:hypothetical protein
MSALIDFFLFWWGCLGDAITAGRAVLSLITVSGFLLWVFYGRKHEHEHEGLKTKKRLVTTLLYWGCGLLLPCYALYIAPYIRYKEANDKSKKLSEQLEDASPRLDGFIDQTITAQTGNTNIMLFQVSIGNAGHLPSIAESFKLRVFSKNQTNEADLIDISDTYRQTMVAPNKTLALALKRSELIAEKTVKAIQPGALERGWIAFTSTNSAFSQSITNSALVLSFIDILGRPINVTNSYLHGKPVISKRLEFPLHLPGSGSILSQAEVVTNSLTWMPPELPADCTNVIIYFGGSHAIHYSLAVARISPENHGTQFLVNELPDFLLKDLDKAPFYSPRMDKVWIRWGGTQQQYGSNLVNLPFAPYVVSNRLYLYVEVPFQGGKHPLIMSDVFDAALSSLPNNWDRNFHTNYHAFEIVNEHTNPVLQVAYPSANEIIVNGLFVVSTNQFLQAFWQPPQLITLTYGFITTTNMEPIPEASIRLALGTNTVGELVTNAMYNWGSPSRKAWFKYPSNRNRSQFADDMHVFH